MTVTKFFPMGGQSGHSVKLTTHLIWVFHLTKYGALPLRPQYGFMASLIYRARFKLPYSCSWFSWLGNSRQCVNIFHIPKHNVNAYLEYKHSSTSNSMKQSSSWQANSHSADAPFWSQKVHYRAHKNPPLDPTRTWWIQSTYILSL
jgi:hypothetical protein